MEPNVVNTNMAGVCPTSQHLFLILYSNCFLSLIGVPYFLPLFLTFSLLPYIIVDHIKMRIKVNHIIWQQIHQ